MIGWSCEQKPLLGLFLAHPITRSPDHPIGHARRIPQVNRNVGIKRMSVEPLLPPIVQHVEFYAALIGRGVGGVVAAPLFVSFKD
jgi:hypothetical protein